MEKVLLATGEKLTGRLKYYDYGVLSVEFKLAFEGNWEKLVALSSRYVAGLEIRAAGRIPGSANASQGQPGVG